MAKINTLFMTKAVKKPYPLGPHIPHTAHIREYPPGENGLNLKLNTVRLKTILRIPTHLLDVCPSATVMQVTKGLEQLCIKANENQIFW